eukprot:11906595-Alexandrium_andersonii.AAC.1
MPHLRVLRSVQSALKQMLGAFVGAHECPSSGDVNRELGVRVDRHPLVGHTSVPDPLQGPPGRF